MSAAAESIDLIENLTALWVAIEYGIDDPKVVVSD
jgi:hypothetical protein